MLIKDFKDTTYIVYISKHFTYLFAHLKRHLLRKLAETIWSEFKTYQVKRMKKIMRFIITILLVYIR